MSLIDKDNAICPARAGLESNGISAKILRRYDTLTSVKAPSGRNYHFGSYPVKKYQYYQ